MILKWIFDRVVALMGLLFLWPILLIIAILVRIKEPGGPILFKQKRVGKDGKLFTIVKFRSMKPKHNGSSISVAGEARITSFGEKLRHYKLDELPELWNVFKGEMSFVGPRPDVPGYANKLKGEQRRMLNLRPGATGPATLKYRNEERLIAKFLQDYKNDSSTREKYHIPDGLNDEELVRWYNDNVIYPDKVRINLYYHDHYSFWKDIQMIVCTLLGKRMKYNGEFV